MHTVRGSHTARHLHIPLSIDVVGRLKVPRGDRGVVVVEMSVVAAVIERSSLAACRGGERLLADIPSSDDAVMSVIPFISSAYYYSHLLYLYSKHKTEPTD
jgi:hypothetical protein